MDGGTRDGKNNQTESNKLILKLIISDYSSETRLSLMKVIIISIIFKKLPQCDVYIGS
jgi:hypothetical protein